MAYSFSVYDWHSKTCTKVVLDSYLRAARELHKTRLPCDLVDKIASALAEEVRAGMARRDKSRWPRVLCALRGSLQYCERCEEGFEQVCDGDSRHCLHSETVCLDCCQEYHYEFACSIQKMHETSMP